MPEYLLVCHVCMQVSLCGLLPHTSSHIIMLRQL